MPDFNLQVPHYHQDGPNCWWYVHRMIHDYHTISNFSGGWLNAWTSAPMEGLPVTTVRPVLEGLGYKPLVSPEFDRKTTCAQVIDILQRKGPLFVPCYKQFNDWKTGHAIVLKGIVNNTTDKWKQDEQLVVLLDPAAPDKKHGGRIYWPLDYVKILLDMTEDESHTLFWYAGLDQRIQHRHKLSKAEKAMHDELDRMLEGIEEINFNLEDFS